MPIEVYRLLHYIGIFMLILALGGAFVHSGNGGTKQNNKFRTLLAMTHGVGLVIILVAGFGMLAKLGYMSALPTWAIVKIAVWLLLGATFALANRAQKLARALWPLTIVLATVAAYFAVFK